MRQVGGENIKRTPPLPCNRVTSREQPQDRGRGKHKEKTRALKTEGGGNRKRTGHLRQREGGTERELKTEGGGTEREHRKTERGGNIKRTATRRVGGGSNIKRTATRQVGGENIKRTEGGRGAT